MWVEEATVEVEGEDAKELVDRNTVFARNVDIKPLILEELLVFPPSAPIAVQL